MPKSQQTTTPNEAFVFLMYFEDLVANSQNKNNKRKLNLFKGILRFEFHENLEPSLYNASGFLQVKQTKFGTSVGNFFWLRAWKQDFSFATWFE